MNVARSFLSRVTAGRARMRFPLALAGLVAGVALASSVVASPGAATPALAYDQSCQTDDSSLSAWRDGDGFRFRGAVTASGPLGTHPVVEVHLMKAVFFGHLYWDEVDSERAGEIIGHWGEPYEFTDWASFESLGLNREGKSADIKMRFAMPGFLFDVHTCAITVRR